jgi:nucleoid-associated protein YgaU
VALKDSYSDVLTAAPNMGVKVTDVKEEGGKLQVWATAEYQYDKDRLWDAVKKHADWEKEVSLDVKVTNSDVFGYHTVVSGDSLSKIAKSAYDNAGAYMKIYEANRDILTDPNMIKPGQRIKIPNK